MFITEAGLVFKNFLEVLSDNLEHEGKQVYYENEKVCKIGFYDEKVVIFIDKKPSSSLYNEINLSMMGKRCAEHFMQKFTSN